MFQIFWETTSAQERANTIKKSSGLSNSWMLMNVHLKCSHQQDCEIWYCLGESTQCCILMTHLSPRTIWLWDMHWPIECGNNDRLPGSSQASRGLGMFLFFSCTPSMWTQAQSSQLGLEKLCGDKLRQFSQQPASH